MKQYHAYQVEPEIQESPLFRDDFPENVYTFGNRYFIEHGDDLKEIRAGLEAIAEAIDAARDSRGWAHDINMNAELFYRFPRPSGSAYTRAERLRLIQLAEEFAEASGSDEPRIIADALTIVRGEEYIARTIRGCCQRDWQYIVFPASYGDEWRYNFEVEYFNTGSEFRIDGVFVYVHGFRAEDIRAEIADAIGLEADAIALHMFDGYKRFPEYIEV